MTSIGLNFGPPATKVRTTFGLRIRARGRTVGAAFSFAPSQSMDVSDEFELAGAQGMPNHIVPGNTTGRELRLGRFDLWRSIAEEVLGTDSIVQLSDQRIPFSLQEFWIPPQALANLFGASVVGVSLGDTVTGRAPARLPSPTDVLTSLESLGNQPKRYMYTGCWITSINRSLSVTDRVSSAEVSIRYTDRIEL
jgi:hypothetical protein